MPVYKIRGIDVDFPFEAYDSQIVYMEKVIQSLQEKRNALLESPTGTGKTLCLLCATLAWRKSFGEFSTNPSLPDEEGWVSTQRSNTQSTPNSSQSENQRSGLPVIIYTSRTHSQLKQVIRELKASKYRPKMAILGSREQMCIHEDVKLLRGRAQNNACQFLCKKRKCIHQAKVSEFVKKPNPLGTEPFDIEDLVNVGRTKGPCPYYVSRELHKHADILFAPYNYLIDPGNRRTLTNIPWTKAVLIFDEAHNLEGICADAASFDLPSNYLTSCITEAKQCIDLCVKKRAIDKSADKQFDPDNYAILRGLLMKLEKKIGEVEIKSKEIGFTKPGNYIFDFFSDLNITYDTASMLMDTIDNAAQLLEEGNNVASGNQMKTRGTVCRLETIRDVLNTIFKDGGKSHALFYRFHVQESQSNFGDFKGKNIRTLSWWCFNPGLAMQEFERLGVPSIILTSGTLSPLDSFAVELNLEFPIRLENPHVIDSHQIWVGVLPTGPSSYPLNSSFRTRDSIEYKQELGNTLVNFARIVPDGLLVFFPSYYMMDKSIECWKSMSNSSSTIWERICKHKQPVIEPKQSALFAHAIEDFEVKLRDKSTTGAIFFAVCRGKVSEGLDFADQAGRAVVITGMPFSPQTDPKVRLKREYLDQQAYKPKKDPSSLKGLTGEEWYVQQAARAVNQAVGRVIRHRHDYGAIIFCDERFAHQGRQEQMSYWLRPHVKCYSKFGEVIFTLTRFFREKKASSSSFKPIKVEDLSDNIDLSLLKDSSSNSLTTSASSTSQNKSGKPILLIQASKPTSRGKIDKFSMGPILPANQANLSRKLQNHPYEIKNDKRVLDSQDQEIIDLTCDTSSSKKPKVFNANKRALPSSFSVQLSEKNKGILVNNSSDCTTSSGCKEGSNKGSAFLVQVRENLSLAEYKEFVGLMKALKMKTMSINPVLESIARLFSRPERFSLLIMFKDFVPPKYHTKYEELLETHRPRDNI